VVAIVVVADAKSDPTEEASNSKMTLAILLLPLLRLVGASAGVHPFTASAEQAVSAMQRPVLVKVDSPTCGDCVKLEEFWGMAGKALPDGTVWRVLCQNTGKDLQ
jgi:hypothetical protein